MLNTYKDNISNAGSGCARHIRCSVRGNAARRPGGFTALNAESIATAMGPALPRFLALNQKRLHPNLLCQASAWLCPDNVNTLAQKIAAGEYSPCCSGFSMGLATGTMDTGQAMRDIFDLFVQYCVASVITPYFGQWLMEGCYDRAASARLKIGEPVVPERFVTVVDLAGFAGMAEPHFIIDAIAEQTGNGRITSVIAGYIKLGILGNGIARHRHDGPYGSPLRILLANIQINPLLEVMTQRKHWVFRIDDLLYIPKTTMRNSFRVADSVRKFLATRIDGGTVKDLVSVESQAKIGFFEIRRGFIELPLPLEPSQSAFELLQEPLQSQTSASAPKQPSVAPMQRAALLQPLSSSAPLPPTVEPPCPSQPSEPLQQPEPPYPVEQPEPLSPPPPEMDYAPAPRFKNGVEII